MMMPNSYGVRKIQQVQFDGYNHTKSCSDGQIYDMKNISSRAFPYLRPIRSRSAFGHSCNHALFAHNALGWVNDNHLFYDNRLIGEVENSPKTIVTMGNRIIIWPDKLVLNASYKVLGLYDSLNSIKAAVENPKEGDAYGALPGDLPAEIFVWNGRDWVSNGPELQPMGNKATFVNVKFKSGTYHEVEADANTMEFLENVENKGFKVGDGVTISGCTKHPENNKTAIIREIEGNQIRFYENAFVLDGEDGLTDYTEPGIITMSRDIPDLDVICSIGNRLWGAKGDTIYASKLGDPQNFNVFDGLTDDSWFQSTGTAGDFTGAVAYLGYPIFFKEQKIFKIFGANAENYEFSQSATMGVKQGASRSLAIAGEVLFYLSPNGLVSYTGGLPESAAAPFGEVGYANAVCGSDGRRLYASMGRETGERELFCLDTETGILTKEDDLAAADWCCFSGVLYALEETGNAVVVNADNGESCPDSYVEFGAFLEGTMNRKGTNRLQMRIVADEGAEIRVLVHYDFDASGIWHEEEVLTATRRQSFSFPIRLKRCDSYQIKIEGHGYWEVQALAREFYVGSDSH